MGHESLDHPAWQRARSAFDSGDKAVRQNKQQRLKLHVSGHQWVCEHDLSV